MQVRFLGQGLIDSTESAGSILIESFQDNEFQSFSCFVAFVGVSGLRQLESHIENSKENITNWNIFVGVDQKGTSKEALEQLLQLDIGSKIYYTRTHITYHPKLYLFEGATKTRLIIGSSNFTERGLFNNVEANIIIDFNSGDTNGALLIREIKDYYNNFLTGENSNLQNLSTELIQELYNARIIPDEQERSQLHNNSDATEENSNETTNRIRDLFPSVPMQRTFNRIRSGNTSERTRLFESNPNNYFETSQEEENLWGRKGQLVWLKPSLSSSDAQSTSQDSTNPTGVLRLTSARYEHEGVPINRNTYFRNNLFGGFDWFERTRPRNSPLQETFIPFRIMIDGDDKGEFILRISHDVDRIANQNNVPTTLHWGDAILMIRESNVEGHTLYLYKPPEGEQTPFFILIERNSPDDSEGDISQFF